MTRIKRVITCQGTIQLVTALAVLRYRELERANQFVTYDNYLVIYGLSIIEEQNSHFVAMIRQMAEAVCSWAAIVYLKPQVFHRLQAACRYSKPTSILQQVYQAVGCDRADEIYLSRDWQFENLLLMNAYASAEKICYGDGIGIYFSETNPAFAPAQGKAVPQPSLTWKQQVVKWKQTLKIGLMRCRNGLNARTELASLKFDQGYFFLPEAFGETPPMPMVLLHRSQLLKRVQQWRGLTDAAIIRQVQARVADAPVYILLTSNLSEARRMSEADEITAYRQFLLAEGGTADTVLLIKPHPRDGAAKLQALKEHLADCFTDVIVLSDPSLFFLPFEIFFMEAFLSPSLQPRNQITVFAVSSASLSLKLLFEVSSHIGFGADLTRKYFYADYIDGRLQHEAALREAIDSMQPQSLS